ncbi:MAG: hypothetical protein ACI8RD_008372, partial [Bacillariaceae sp.]
MKHVCASSVYLFINKFKQDIYCIIIVRVMGERWRGGGAG